MSPAVRESEREPPREVFHRPETIKEVRIILTEKDREMIRQSVEDIKKWFNPKWESDGARNIANEEKGNLEIDRKRVVKDEKLTERTISLMREVAKQFMSGEEVERVVNDFKGAGYIEGERIDSFVSEGGKYLHDSIIIDRKALDVLGDSLLVHEIGHYLHGWVMAKNFNGDPILKTVHDYLKPFGYEDGS